MSYNFSGYPLNENHRDWCGLTRDSTAGRKSTVPGAAVSSSNVYRRTNSVNSFTFYNYNMNVKKGEGGGQGRVMTL